jgi:hypothetical protein
MLVEQKEVFPNLKIVKNNGSPIGYASNINWIFQQAKTDIVSYLQSDNIVCLDYDKKLLSHLTENIILSSCRVEPPLHSKNDNGVTYVRNFGYVPDEFQYEEFLKFAEENKNPIKLTNFFFAPFTLHRKLWNDIGGHDVRFLKSREDSDIALRFALNNINLVQCWDAMVYHFTCTSSRGIEWWKPENQGKDVVRQQNDQIELKRFIDKWGTFIHATSPRDIVGLNLDKSKIFCKNPPINDSLFQYL